MEDKEKIESEIEELKEELESFKEEKERIRAIVGKIGGVPTFNSTLFNVIFAVLIVLSLTISLLSGEGTLRLLMIELATVLISLKIIYLIHCQARVNHFKLWVLSSIEWRLNELMKMVRSVKDS